MTCTPLVVTFTGATPINLPDPSPCCGQQVGTTSVRHDGLFLHDGSANHEAKVV